MKYIPFDSRDILYKTPFGAVNDSQTVTFRLLLHNDARCCLAFLRLREDGGEEQLIELLPDVVLDENYRWFKTEMSLKEGLYWYSFCYDSAYGRMFVSRFKNGEGYVSNEGGEWQLTVYRADYKTPDCFKGGIIYQIFPDRFYFSGTQKKNVPCERFIQTDKQAVPEHRQNNGACSLGNDYFGGDLEGIQQKLPYLSELGVSIIYLNPIFEAHSNHRYNTADYMRVDSLLGDENNLKELCACAQKYGISIVLDGVFSHTGDDSRYFNKYNRYKTVGAYNSTESEYFNWYKFENWPDKYSAWWGIMSLPETNEENNDFVSFITGENGVLRYWIRQGIKGWRLDVADELPDSFLDKIRVAVKEEDPNAIIIGEVWEDATNKISYGTRRRYLRGSQLDSVMNYPFATAIIEFLTNGNAELFFDIVCSIYENYPKEALHLLMNHIGTHDTERILTALGAERALNKSREWQSKSKMTDEQLQYAKKLLYLAAIIQYTLPGIPSLYYGDETGVQGYGDPFCRSFYPWGNEDMYLVDFYKKIGKFRRGCEAFFDGDFVPLYCGDGVIAFSRKGKKEQVAVCVNRCCDHKIIDVGPLWNDATAVFGYTCDNGKVMIDGLGFTVLRKNV